MATMIFRSHAGELGERVIHVKSLIVQDFFEDGTGRRIMVHHVPINSEAARRCFFRQMKESQHRLIRFIVHLQIIKTMATWCKPFTMKPGCGTRGQRTQKCSCATAEHNPMPELV